NAFWESQWATSEIQFSRPNRDHDELREQVLGTAAVPWPSEPGATGGGASPDDIARSILTHVAAESGPLRLVLGDGAAEQIKMVFENTRQDYSTQLDPGPEKSN